MALLFICHQQVDGKRSWCVNRWTAHQVTNLGFWHPPDPESDRADGPKLDAVQSSVMILVCFYTDTQGSMTWFQEADCCRSSKQPMLCWFHCALLGSASRMSSVFSLSRATHQGVNLWGWGPGWWWWSPGRLALGWVAAALPARHPRQVGCRPTGSTRSAAPASDGPPWNWPPWNWPRRPRASRPRCRSP